MAIQKSTFILSLIIAVLISIGAGIATYHFVLKDMWYPKSTNSVTMQNATTTVTTPTPNVTNTQPIRKQPTTIVELFPGIKFMKIGDAILDIRTYTSGNPDDVRNYITLSTTPGVQIPTEEQFCQYAGEGCGYNKNQSTRDVNTSRIQLNLFLDNNTPEKIWSEIKRMQEKENFVFSSSIATLFFQRIAIPGFMIMPIEHVQLTSPLENSVAFVASEGQDIDYNFQLRLVGRIGEEFYTASMFLDPYCTNESDSSESCNLEKKLKSCTSTSEKGCSYNEVASNPVVQEKIAKAVKKMESVLLGK